jgi:hypothetical protein
VALEKEKRVREQRRSELTVAQMRQLQLHTSALPLQQSKVEVCRQLYKTQ